MVSLGPSGGATGQRLLHSLWGGSLRSRRAPAGAHRIPSPYDLVMWAYYAGYLRRPPDPARFVLERPAWLPEGGKVLDFGGGDGRWALPLAAGRRARVTVADIDEGALRRVPRHPLVRTTLLGGRGLPFGDGAFDLVFVNHVIHHLEGLAPALQELRRVVTAGGRIVCVEFHPACAVTRIYRLLSRFRRHPCTFFTPEALASLLGVHPFITEHRMMDNFQYVVSACRVDRRPGISVPVCPTDGASLT